MKLILIFLLLPVFSVQAQTQLDKKINQTVSVLKCVQPDERDPVKIVASVVNVADSFAVIIKVKLAPGWHIYQYVPSNLPYIPIGLTLQMPDCLRSVGDWKKSDPMSSANDPGVLIYENEAVFVQKIVKMTAKSSPEHIKTGLYYQTCNLRQCLPPTEKVIVLKVQ